MKKTYSCEYCKIFATDNSGMWGKHTKNCWANPNSLNQINTKWECNICNNLFMSRSKLISHRRKTHNNQKKIRMCISCKKEWFVSEYFFEKHKGQCFSKKEEIEECGKIHLSSSSISASDFDAVEEQNARNVGIYSITTPSNKVYVGMTTIAFSVRWKNHRKLLKAGRHYNKALQKSYDKYGWDNLKKDIEKEYPKSNNEVTNVFGEFLLKQEQAVWDDFYSKGYSMLNGRPSGYGSVYHLSSTKTKIKNELYFHNQSFCKLWVRTCLNCSAVFTAQKGDKRLCNAKVCIGAMRKRTPKKRPQAKIKKTCKKKGCHAPVSFNSSFCSVACQYIRCHRFGCNNYCLKEGKNSYCSLEHKKGIEDINSNILYNMHVIQLMSIANMALELRTSEPTLRKHMKNLGIHIMQPHEMTRARYIKNAPSYGELYQLYKERNMSIRAITLKYNVHRKQVIVWLDHYNLN